MGRWEATRFTASAGFRSLFAVCIALCSVALADTSPPAPVPTQRLNLSTVGYLELSALARRSGQANLSLNFLDTDHVLLTLSQQILFKRLPGLPLALTRT